MRKMGVPAASGGRATIGSAIAAFVRSLCSLPNGYAAFRIPNAIGLLLRQKIFYCVHRFADIFSQLFH